MKQVALTVVWLLICPPSFVLAQTSGLVAEWSFNESSGQVVHDSVSGTDDAIGGLFKRVSGVSGNGLRFDGESTIVTRGYRGVPQTTAGVTADAWVAVNTYPWNWVPIVEQRREEQAGYSFGIDSFGHIGLKVAVGGQWWSLVSKSQLPLKKWSHVAGSYDPAKGMAIYVRRDKPA
jgi:beta-fructofuranosidase